MAVNRGNTIAPVDRLAQVNDPSPEAFRNPAQLEFMRVLIEAIRRMSQEMVANNSASSALLLRSPNGTVFKITVSDAGALQVVNARG